MVIAKVSSINPIYRLRKREKTSQNKIGSRPHHISIQKQMSLEKDQRAQQKCISNSA